MKIYLVLALMLIKNYLLGVSLSASMLMAQTESESWADTLEFSLYASVNGKQGASESDDMVLGLEATHDNQLGSVWELAVQGDLQRTKNRTVERSYDISLDYNKAYANSPWGWYTGLSYEVDSFQDIEKETSVEFGASLDLFDYMGKEQKIDELRSHDWKLRVGTIYTESEYATGQTSEGQGFSLGYIYKYEHKDSYTFNQALAYEFYVDENELDTIALENSVEFPFAANQNLKLKIGLDYEYYPNVTAGSEDYEFTYYSNIVWNF